MPNVKNYFRSITITKIMVNWSWVQVEGHALASIIALAFERGEDSYKNCGIGWLLLITVNVLQEGNNKLRLASSLLKAS